MKIRAKDSNGKFAPGFEDMAGLTYGRWLILETLDRTFSVCKCECGSVKKVRNSNLRHGKTKQCGSCAQRSRARGWFANGFQDMTGERFGSWEVLRTIDCHISECRCDCGTVKVVYNTHLRGGKSKRCTECNGRSPHGSGLGRKKRNRFYILWHGMRNRCKYRPNYAGRGITICKEWEDVNTFIEWCEKQNPETGLSIDRIDNNGNYSPDNCRFITNRKQSLNRRDTIMTSFGGSPISALEFVERYLPELTRQRWVWRVKAGWSGEDLLEYFKASQNA